MGLPFASLLAPDRDSGISFSADLANMPILPFEVRMWRDRDRGATWVSIRRSQVRLEPNGTNVVALHVGSHGGDWREGLAWIRDEWPSLFIVPDGIGRFQMAFWSGTGFFEGAYERTVEENLLKHGIFQTRPRPWFGLNIADWEPWMIGVDQKYYLLRKMEDIPGRPESDRRLRPWFNRLWRPIQIMLQERMQILEPNCLTLPAGFEGNVFQRPDGNVVVPIVTPGASRMSPYEWADLPVVLRFSDAARVRRVYQISDDRLGPLSLDFKRRGRAIHVTVPRHRAVSMLVLTAAGKFTSLDDQTVRPEGGTVALHHDDLDQGSRGRRTTRTIDVPAPQAGARFALIQPEPVADTVLPNSILEIDRRPDFELRVEDVVQITLGPDPAMVYQPHETHGGLILPAGLSLAVDEEATVQATAHNHGDELVTLTLSAGAPGMDVEPGSVQVTVPARGRKTVDLRVCGRGVGKTTLTATAGPAATQIEIDVIGTRLAAEDLGRIRSARLIVGSITNGQINEQMTINGVAAGLLRQRVGHPVWDRRADHVLAKEAVAALKADGNVLEVATGKRRFAVSRPIIEVELEDDRRVHLATTDPTQSTPPDWPQAHGKRVESGGKMRWRFP